MFVFALVAAGYRLTPPVSDEMVARSVPDGHGRNVVNVILVDFRGFDTLGRDHRARRRRRSAPSRSPASGAGPPSAGRRSRRRRRRPAHGSPFVDVSVRVVFHAVLMMSLWLLFAGHNQPGGGFVGGLLAGSAITLRYIAGGIDEVRGHVAVPAVDRARRRPPARRRARPRSRCSSAASVLEVGFASLDLPGRSATVNVELGARRSTPACTSPSSAWC